MRQALLRGESPAALLAGSNTTIGVIATDAVSLTKTPSPAPGDGWPRWPGPSHSPRTHAAGWRYPCGFCPRGLQVCTAHPVVLATMATEGGGRATLRAVLMAQPSPPPKGCTCLAVRRVKAAMRSTAHLALLGRPRRGLYYDGIPADLAQWPTNCCRSCCVARRCALGASSRKGIRRLPAVGTTRTSTSGCCCCVAVLAGVCRRQHAHPGGWRLPAPARAYAPPRCMDRSAQPSIWLAVFYSAASE